MSHLEKNKLLETTTESSHMLENGFTIEKRDHYITQVLNDASDGSWLYEREYKYDNEKNGSYLFDQAVRGQAYASKFHTQEQQLLLNHKDEILPYFSDSNVKNIIHLGPGDGGKFVRLIKTFPVWEKIVAGKKYIAADISNHARMLSSDLVQRELMMKTDVIAGDWLETSLISATPDKFVFFDGGSIGNFERSKAKNLLRNIASDSWIRGRNLMMGYFLAPQKDSPDYDERVQSLIAAYHTPEVEKRIISGFHELGVDTSKLEFVVEYDVYGTDGIAAIKVGARVREGEEVRIPLRHYHGSMHTKSREVVIGGGKTLRAIKSRRYSPDQMEKLCQDAGYKVEKNFMTLDEGLIIIKNKSILQNKIAENIGKVKVAVLGTLLATGGLVTNNMWDAYKHQKRVDQKIIENIKYKFVDSYGGNGNDPAVMEQRLEEIENLAEEIYEVMIVRYAKYNFPSQKQVVNALKIILSQGDNLKYFAALKNENGQMMRKENMIYFIDHIFWPGFSSLSAEIDYLQPYEHLGVYETVMKETWELEEEVVLENDRKNSIDHPYISQTTGQKFNELGTYIADNGKEYEIAQVVMWHHKSHSHKEYFMARPIDEVGYNTIDGKRVIYDYFQKGYVTRLADKISGLLVEGYTTKDQNPGGSLRNNVRLLSGGDIYSVRSSLSEKTYKHAALVNVLIELNMAGYDFSFLLEEGSEEMLSRFTKDFLPAYISGLSEDEQWKLKTYNNLSASQERELSMIHTIEKVNDYLAMYFTSTDTQEGQNLFGLKKELLKEMLQSSSEEYKKIKTEDDVFSYLYARKELCQTYGFQLNTWREFGNFESVFRELLTNPSIKEDFNDISLMMGKLNYFNNFYRTKKGDIYSVAGRGRYAVAMHVTPENAYPTLQENWEKIKKEMRARIGDRFKSIEPSAWADLGKHHTLVHFINQHYIPFTLDDAKVVARDYFEQKYTDQITQGMVQIIEHEYCAGSMSDEERSALGVFINKSLLGIHLSGGVTVEELALLGANSDHGNEMRKLFMRFVLFKKHYVEFNKILHGGVDYRSVDVEKEIDNFHLGIEFFQRMFISPGSWRFEKSELNKKLKRAMSRNKKPKDDLILETTLIYLIYDTDENISALSTELDWYKFFMKHGKKLHELGYSYIDLDEISGRGHQTVYKMIGETRKLKQDTKKVSTKDMGGYKITIGLFVASTGEKFMVAVSGREKYFYAKPVFSKEELELKRRELIEKYAKEFEGNRSHPSLRTKVENEINYLTSADRSAFKAKYVLDDIAKTFGEEAWKLWEDGPSGF